MRAKLLDILKQYDENKTLWRRVSDRLFGGHSRSAAMTALATFIIELSTDDPNLSQAQLDRLRDIKTQYQEGGPATRQALTRISVEFGILNPQLQAPKLTSNFRSLLPIELKLTDRAFEAATNFSFPPAEPLPLILYTAPPFDHAAFLREMVDTQRNTFEALISQSSLRLFETIQSRHQNVATRWQASDFSTAGPARSDDTPLFKQSTDYKESTVVLLGKKALEMAKYLPSDYTINNYDSMYYQVGKALIDFFHNGQQFDQVDIAQDALRALKLIIERQLNAQAAAHSVPWVVINIEDVAHQIFNKLVKQNPLFYYQLVLDVAEEIHPSTNEHIIRLIHELRNKMATMTSDRNEDELMRINELIKIMYHTTTLFNRADESNHTTPSPGFR